ncbi:helix-turn-helix domain-containing protein [Ornithinibacillus sp. L9]|uniref:Helix-turn-helix domain-containing protein n=1 Tax=Ornithinibacillus caprae TaxID=2678566 RepID=A0A6N8FM33_9BACI|nr:helix-turn-helix transcriptional regulator [Ornithinibacillus caprae]MUK89057.1 helix-turn-helix domain-containing protein [Ornithinibacillus caprae]
MIGKRINKIRLDKGYSLALLAEMSGVSKSYLSYLERDLRTNPSLQVLTRIAQALGCSLEYLLGDEMIAVEKQLKEELDDEVVFYLKNAIEEGTIKADLEEFQKYIEFLNWKATNK